MNLRTEDHYVPSHRLTDTNERFIAMIPTLRSTTTPPASIAESNVVLDPSVASAASAAPSAAVERTLPRRCDVHQLEWLSELFEEPLTVLDGSSVEMVDLPALGVLDAIATSTTIRIVNPSVALLATMRYTGHHRLVDACVGADLSLAA